MTVTADDVRDAVAAVCVALRTGLDRDWDVPAGSVEWSCRRTAEHVADDFVAYAAQVAAQRSDGYLPFEVALEAGAAPADVVDVVAATGALLAATVQVAPPQSRAWHPYGSGDPEAFAAMGVVEAFVHTHDICTGLGISWAPPGDLCERVLERLFPERPRSGDPWTELLWCTGRAELPGRPRLTQWRWHNEPVVG